MRFTFLKALSAWLSQPSASRLSAAVCGAATGFVLVLIFFCVEVLTIFGRLDPAQAGFLKTYADIPPEVIHTLGRRVAVGALSVYLLVAGYFSFACGVIVSVWGPPGRLPSPRFIGGIVLSLFIWVTMSAALRLLAVHPYAAEGIPWLKGVEPHLRSWWTPGLAVGATVVMAMLFAYSFSFQDPFWYGARRAAFLFILAPLLGPHVSALAVEVPGAAETKAASSPPPIVLIGIDSLRPDHVSRWGGSSHLTPHLDAFLAESFEFTNAWTVAGRTHPSYVSLLTARTPDRHGVRYNRADPFFARRLPKTLGHALIEAGYSTRYLTDDNMFSLMGLDHGFQKVGQPPTTLETYVTRRFMRLFFVSSLPARYTSAFLPALKHNRAIHSNYDSKDLSDAVSQAIAEDVREGRPFFITAHLCTSHYPGSQPGPEFRAFQPPEAPAIDYFKASLAHLKDGDMHVSKARDDRLRGLYKAGVRRADAELGRILSYLGTQGLLERAWVVVWSDHGESFADRNGHPILPSHGLAVDEGGEDLRIVLGIRPPGGHHVRVERPVRSIDVTPTLLAGLGLPALPGEREGRALQPLIRGETTPEPILYAESGTHYGRPLDEAAARYDFDLLRLYRFDPVTRELATRRHFHDKLILTKQRMVQKGEFRLVYEPMMDGSKRRRLFKWTLDERPARDVRADYPEVYAELDDALVSHLTDLEPDKLAVGVKKDAITEPWFPWMRRTPPGPRKTSAQKPQ